MHRDKVRSELRQRELLLSAPDHLADAGVERVATRSRSIILGVVVTLWRSTAVTLAPGFNLFCAAC